MAEWNIFNSQILVGFCIWILCPVTLKNSFVLKTCRFFGNFYNLVICEWEKFYFFSSKLHVIYLISVPHCSGWDLRHVDLVDMASFCLWIWWIMLFYFQGTNYVIHSFAWQIFVGRYFAQASCWVMEIKQSPPSGVQVSCVPWVGRWCLGFTSFGDSTLCYFCVEECSTSIPMEQKHEVLLSVWGRRWYGTAGPKNKANQELLAGGNGGLALQLP